jgi:DNA primase
MNIQEIKEKYTCLDYLGQPAKKTRNGYLYRAPWREDTHPSLSVTANGRGWHDLATGEHGSVIDLVMRCLNTNDVRLACQEIERQAPSSFSFSQPVKSDGEKEKDTSFTKFEVMKLQSKGLFAYLYHRKVNIEISKQFLMEAHYSFKDSDSYLYALAYANDKGGYELRSSFYKGSTSPKGITTHWLIDAAPVVVFEGFFDMLSFATLCGGVKHNYIVLNSIVNKEAALEVLKTLQNQIYLCLDNDKGGDDATAFLLDALPSAVDIRKRFAPAKDVNDYLLRL